MRIKRILSASLISAYLTALPALSSAEGALEQLASWARVYSVSEGAVQPGGSAEFLSAEGEAPNKAEPKKADSKKPAPAKKPSGKKKKKRCCKKKKRCRPCRRR